MEIKSFTKADFDNYFDLANKPYYSEGQDNEIIIDFFRSICSKVKRWGNQIVEQLSGFEMSHECRWLQNGWEEGNQVSQIKPYIWAKIYATEFETRDIFFTIGINSEDMALVYKLDYNYANSSLLTESQKSLFEQILPQTLVWNGIYSEDAVKYTFTQLVSEVVHFINSNIQIYREIVLSVLSGNLNTSFLENRLIYREITNNISRKHKVQSFSEDGYVIDWVSHNQQMSKIGEMGERLVMEDEKKHLIKNERSDLLWDVKKVKDGKGYDIKSRNIDESIKYIEVKTTTSTDSSPFFLTKPEIDFWRQNVDCFYLYRLYNLNLEKKVAEVNIYHGNPEDFFELEPIVFTAFKK